MIMTSLNLFNLWVVEVQGELMVNYTIYLIDDSQLHQDILLKKEMIFKTTNNKNRKTKIVCTLGYIIFNRRGLQVKRLKSS
jgi:hypothetical protein